MCIRDRLELVDELPTARAAAATELGLSETEFSFYNILVAEVTNGEDAAIIDPDQQQAITDTTRKLVEMFEETTQIVDVFNKPDQIKSMKKSIKRAVVDQPFYSAKQYSIAGTLYRTGKTQVPADQLMMAAEPEYIQTSGFIAEVIRTPRRKTATIKVDDRVVSIVVPQDLNEQRLSLIHI